MLNPVSGVLHLHPFSEQSGQVGDDSHTPKDFNDKEVKNLCHNELQPSNDKPVDLAIATKLLANTRQRLPH
jgi:hypothetical protein